MGEQDPQQRERPGKRRVKPPAPGLHTFIAERFDRLEQRLETLANVVHRLESKQEMIMADLTRLGQEVAETAAVVDSAIVLINGLADQIRALEPSQAALNAFADQLDGKANELAAAVAQNTPPVEPPPEEPPV